MQVDFGQLHVETCLRDICGQKIMSTLGVHAILSRPLLPIDTMYVQSSVSVSESPGDTARIWLQHNRMWILFTHAPIIRILQCT